MDYKSVAAYADLLQAEERELVLLISHRLNDGDLYDHVLDLDLMRAV